MVNHKSVFNDLKSNMDRFIDYPIVREKDGTAFKIQYG